jgi:hypothetical protein
VTYARPVGAVPEAGVERKVALLILAEGQRAAAAGFNSRPALIMEVKWDDGQGEGYQRA